MGVMIGAGKAVHADGNGAGEGATLCGMGATISRGTSAEVTCKRCVKMLAAQPAPVFTGDPVSPFGDTCICPGFGEPCGCPDEEAAPIQVCVCGMMEGQRFHKRHCPAQQAKGIDDTVVVPAIVTAPERPAPLECGCSPMGAHNPLCNAMRDVTCRHDFAGFALCEKVKGHADECRDMWGHLFPNPAAAAAERAAAEELADGALAAADGDFRDASRRLWTLHDVALTGGEDRVIRIAVGALAINGRREWRAEKAAAAASGVPRIAVCRFKASKARRGNSKPRKLATR